MTTLVDTGPLVAIYHRDDAAHQTCVAALRRLRGTLLTTWHVVTEAVHLLGFSHAAQDAVLSTIERGVLRIASLDEKDVPRIRELMEKYADHPMDLADATLVRVAERERLSVVFTLDRNDFGVYRMSRNRSFKLIP
jgi:predicted nucleic acid-binding protein